MPNKRDSNYECNYTKVHVGIKKSNGIKTERYNKSSINEKSTKESR